MQEQRKLKQELCRCELDRACPANAQLYLVTGEFRRNDFPLERPGFSFRSDKAVITQHDSPVFSQIYRPSEFSRLALTELSCYVKVAYAYDHHVPLCECKHQTCNNLALSAGKDDLPKLHMHSRLSTSLCGEIGRTCNHANRDC